MARLKRADVVIVGLGAAGGLAALPLAKAGLDVVGLEAGGRVSVKDFAPDEIRNNHRNWFGRTKANLEIPTVRRTSSETARPLTLENVAANASAMVNAVGGSTLHWTGVSFRFHPWNFQTRTEVVRRLGEGAIPAGATLEDWPLDYGELEPYYDRVEYLFGISGKAGNIRGTIDPRGNVFEGPRDREYPLPPLRRTGHQDMMDSAARRLGWHPFPGPAGIRSQPYEGLPACEYRGFCTANACHANAKAGVHLSAIPQAERTGNLRVVTRARVVEITTNRSGRATGVRYVMDGRTYFQPARVVLLSTYTYENVRLLLLSRSKAYPQGLSNNAGQVGRHYTTHNFFGRLALFPGRRLNRFYGTGPQQIGVDDFEGGVMDASGRGFVSHGGLHSGGGEYKPIQAAHSVSPSVRGWGSEWKDWLRRNAGSIAGASAYIDTLTYEQNRLDLDPTYRDPFGRPVVRVTFDHGDNERRAFAFYRDRIVEWLREAGASETWGANGAPEPQAISSHAFGGTRMGSDPDRSVVDRWGFSHEAPNLGILGGSVFVTAGGTNPTETIWALAWRTADHLVSNWRSIAG